MPHETFEGLDLAIQPFFYFGELKDDVPRYAWTPAWRGLVQVAVQLLPKRPSVCRLGRVVLRPQEVFFQQRYEGRFTLLQQVTI